MDFVAGASHLWTNVETVHRTVSLSLLASQASAFAPISGPNPHCLYQIKTNHKSDWFLFGGDEDDKSETVLSSDNVKLLALSLKLK